MFTGLIEATGRIEHLSRSDRGLRMAIRTTLAGELRLGESVAVSGVCLTVTDLGDDEWVADVGPETLRMTTLGRLSPGDSVNLERSMRADGRFGGHMVQGHVDGVGVVEEVRAEGDAQWIRVSYDAALLRLLVRKGAVAVDGVSLTVARLEGGVFDVMVIPFTWAHTTLAERRKGDPVNIECDVVGKYVARAMETLTVRPDFGSE
jgi:riboflavin synthase